MATNPSGTAYQRALEAVRESGLNWQEPRPGKNIRFAPEGHRNLSASIINHGDHVGLKCFGNEEGSEDEVWRDQLGLSPADFWDNPRGTSYNYSDGRRVTRGVNRSFAQEFFNPVTNKKLRKGQYSTSDYSALYNVENITPTGPVYVVEGEKDVNTAVAQFGVNAVSKAGGGNAPEQADWSPLAGHDVIIVADNDMANPDPKKRHTKGIDYANDLYRLLTGGKIEPPKSVKIVMAAEGKDLTDHIDAGHNLDELVDVDPPEPNTNEPADDDRPIYSPDSQPMTVAREVIHDHYTDEAGHRTLAHWCGDWYRYNGTYWQKLNDNDGNNQIKKELWELLENAATPKNDVLVPWTPTRQKIENILEPLKMLSFLSGAVEAPAMISTGQKKPGHIVMGNGILRLDHKGEATLEDHNADLFTTWGLDFNYNPDADCPNWKKFLADIFAHDPKGAALLQEYCGYLISGRTDMQKLLFIVGPPRAGKGVIQRVITRVMGEDNVVSPTFGDIANEFGLKQLIGKPLAIIADARDTGRRTEMPVERILNIVGEDQMSVNRKGKDHWSGKLPTRFVIASNKLPGFVDSSGAIVSRFMSISLKKSFLGKEDHGLETRLAAETEGIFLWALAGLKRLEKNGTFTIPATMKDTNDLLTDLASPVSNFVDDVFYRTGEEDDVITLKEAYGRYRQWCEDNGCGSAKQQAFRNDLQSIGVTCKNTSPGCRPKGRYVFGLKLKPLAA